MNLFDIILTIILFLRTVNLGNQRFQYAGVNEVKINEINIHTIFLNASFLFEGNY